MNASAPGRVSALETAEAAVIESISDAVVVASCVVLTVVGTGVWSFGLHYNDALTASLGSALVTMGVLGYALRKVIARETRNRLLAFTDALTGLANRRRFDQCLEREWTRAAASGRPLALALVDVDHFKTLNDRHGHPAGDACLREIAAALCRVVRTSDLVARYGGEEFAVLFSGLGEASLLAAADRLRLGVLARGICRDDTRLGLVTVSIGAASHVPAIGVSPATLVGAADAALYEAKRQGRNRTVARPRGRTLRLVAAAA